MAKEYRFGEIVLVEYPFSDGIREKLRPGFIISSQPDGDILVARITSKPPKVSTDVALLDWKESALMNPSTVRLEKLSNVLAKRVFETIGIASERDRLQVLGGLRAFVDRLE